MKNPAPFGYHGCYLRIDVSRGSVDRVPLPEAVLRQFLGGSGLGAWLLLEEGDPRTDPLAAEAPLVFAFSPLVGSPLTTSAKFAVVSKSPLTDRINDSLASSGFAIAGKRCGCDAIVIVGRAAELSVLIVDDGRVRLEVGRGPSRRHVPGDRIDVESAARRRLSDRVDRPRRRARGPLRHDLARRPPRRPRRERGRAGQQERQGDCRARHTAL